LLCRLSCWRGRGGVRQCLLRLADSSLEISKELRFSAEFGIRRLKEARRRWAVAGVVTRCHHPQAPADEGRGGVACGASPPQSSDVLFFEPNRRRNQACHTFTIQEADAGTQPARVTTSHQRSGSFADSPSKQRPSDGTCLLPHQTLVSVCAQTHGAQRIDGRCPRMA
jgi:hypothetical protein